MSDEFESLNSRIPDLATVLANRISQRKQLNPPTTSTSTAGFDPYQALLKKKEEETLPIDSSTIQKWPDEDLKQLEDYCQTMGIVGFQCGRMNPKAALLFLKRKFGEDFSGIPLEERMPSGYEKLGNNVNNSNYPYSIPANKKQILHG